MDPTGGTVAYITGKLLDEVISKLEKVIRHKKYCAILKDVIMDLQPHVDKAIELLQRPISVTDQNSVQNWLQRCQNTLQEATKIAITCGELKLKWYSIYRKYQTTNSIIDITNRVRKDLKSTELATLTVILTQAKQIEEIHSAMVPKIIDSSTTIEHHDIPQSIVGLDDMSKQLQQLLFSNESDSHPRYVGVWGMGGIGKTLLAKKAYNSMEVQQHFQGSSFIWLTVGKNPDRRSLYQTLSEKLGLSRAGPSNDADYQCNLYNVFIKRRVFFVLDDVWHQETFDWLDLAKGLGSITLLTSRSEEILNKPNVEMLHVPHLSKEDSWNLFCVHAFGATNCNVPHGLEEVARLVARKCKGLPLALKVIGGTMFNETDVKQWKLQLEKLQRSHNINTNVEVQLFEVLKLSYDDLEPQLKDCFFYFAAYPEDHSVQVSELIAYWEGEGLVPRDGIGDPSAEARSLLKSLIKRSFIEVVRGALEESDCICKIHDVMRDLVFYISIHGNKPLKEQLFLFQAGQNLKDFPIDWTTKPREHFNVQRLSLMYNHLTSLPETTFLAPNMCTLLLKGNGILSIPKDFLKGVQNLKVLDLAFCEFQSLPEAFGDLKELRYLNLSYCSRLDALPESLGNIMKLNYFELSGCHKLQTLPMAMYNLKGLKTLNLKNCHQLNVDLFMVGTFKSLQVFNMSNNFLLIEIPRCFENLQALVELHMQGCKYLVRVGALPRGLQHLDLSDCPKLKELPSFEDVPMLSHLILYQCPSLTNLQGFDSLKNLVEVDLSGYSLFQKTLIVKPCRDLKVCHLIGSGISMPYNNNWLETTPPLQVVSYYDNELKFMKNGNMTSKVIIDGKIDLCMEGKITREEECVAMIFTFVINYHCIDYDQGFIKDRSFLEARIVRANKKIYKSFLFFLHNFNEYDVTYSCTLRKEHQFVQYVKHGDIIQVYAHVKYDNLTLSLKQSAMCVVYKTIEDIHVDVNGGMEIQSNMGVSSKELKTSFDGLVLVDNPHIFDNFNTLDIKSFKTTTFEISTTTFERLQYGCDGCDWVPIVTRRWHCDICSDFDFCEVCHSLNNHEHPMSTTYPPPTNYITINTFRASGILLKWKKFNPRFNYTLWSLYEVVRKWLQHPRHIEPHGRFVMWIESELGSPHLFNVVTLTRLEFEELSLKYHIHDDKLVNIAEGSFTLCMHVEGAISISHVEGTFSLEAHQYMCELILGSNMSRM